MSDPHISERRHFKAAKVQERHVVEFPYFGYLDSFEVKLQTPQPNMNASDSPWRAIIEVFGPNGERPAFQVLATFREVSTAAEAARK